MSVLLFTRFLFSASAAKPSPLPPPATVVVTMIFGIGRVWCMDPTYEISAVATGQNKILLIALYSGLLTVKFPLVSRLNEENR